MKPYIKTVLLAALEARKTEVMDYQINITNYELAIQRIGCDTTLADFKKQLIEGLAANRHEQRKAQIMLDVIESQFN